MDKHSERAFRERDKLLARGDGDLFPPEKATMDDWISVRERLPEDDRDVLVAMRRDDYPVWIGWYDADIELWNDCNGGDAKVTHWRELPAGPEET